jgi:hypothetical protein
MPEAETLYREVLDKRRGTLGPLDPKTIVSVHNLGDCYRRFDQPERALPLLREAYESSARALPEGHWNTAQFESHLGRCLLELDRFEEAEVHLLHGYEGLRDALGPDHSRTQKALDALVGLYERTGQTTKADQYASGADGQRIAVAPSP